MVRFFFWSKIISNFQLKLVCIAGVGLGAMDSLIPFATLISTAQFLSRLLPERVVSDNPNVLFVLFNGESYDYIGSQRFVYDVKKGSFPSQSQGTHEIGMDNIEMMIDIGALDDLQRITVHHAREFKDVCASGLFVQRLSC